MDWQTILYNTVVHSKRCAGWKAARPGSEE